MPPLRERRSDIPLLVEHFLNGFARERKTALYDVSSETMDLLIGYAWPGNVRELQTTLRQATLQATGPVLLPEFLPAELRKPSSGPSAASPKWESPINAFDGFIQSQIHRRTTSLYADSIVCLERTLLDRVLHHTSGNQSRAAEILGITRGTLRNKIREHGIRISRSVRVDGEPDETEVPMCISGP